MADLWGISEYFPERRLLNEPEVGQELSDIYWGREMPHEVTLEFSNADGFFSSLLAQWELTAPETRDDFRGKVVTLKRYEPKEDTQIQVVLYGIITSFEINEKFVCTVSPKHNEPFSAKLPPRVLTVNDWMPTWLASTNYQLGDCVRATSTTNSYVYIATTDGGSSGTSEPSWPTVDGQTIADGGMVWTCRSRATLYVPEKNIGLAYNIVFGYHKKVPCLYVKASHVTGSKYYDYIVGFGEIESVDAVYVNHRAKSTGFTINEGVASKNGVLNPYRFTINGETVYMAFIRFDQELRDGGSGGSSGTTLDVHADVKGLKLGGSTCNRNFATVLKYLLNNKTWGLNLAVNNASFETARLLIESVYDEVLDVNNTDGGCSACISEQVTADQVINDLLFACRGSLRINSSGERVLECETYQNVAAYSLGEGDGYYENCNIDKVYKIPTSEVVKTAILKYGWNFWTNAYQFESKRNIRTFGEEVTYETRVIADHLTADKLTSYIRGREYYCDTRIELAANMELRSVQLNDVVRLSCPRLSINGAYQVRQIPASPANNPKLVLASYNAGIFTYNATSPLPGDPYNDNLPDYSQTPPLAPTVVVVSQNVIQSSDGTFRTNVLIRATKNATQPLNFLKMQFGWLEENDLQQNNYAWVDGTPQYNPDTGVWQGVAAGLTPGRNYYLVARAINQFDLKGDVGNTSPALTLISGDSTAPAQITDLSASAGVKSVWLRWMDNITPAADLSHYEVQRKTTSGGTWAEIAKVKVNQFTDDSPTQYVSYSYRVRGKDKTGNPTTDTNWSNIVAATPGQIGTPDINAPTPDVPISVTISQGTLYRDASGIEYGIVTVGWSAAADPTYVAKYEVLYKKYDGVYTAGWQSAGFVGVSATRSVTISQLIPGVTYSFGVRSVSAFNKMSAIVLGTDTQITKDATNPNAPATPSGSVSSKTWKFQWTCTKSVDHRYYRVRLYVVGNGTPILDAFQNGEAITYTYTAAVYNSTALYCIVNSIDWSGNSSSDAQSSSHTCTQLTGSGGGGTSDVVHIDTLDLEELAVTTAKIENLAVTDAKIGSLSANKIDAGVLYIGGTAITSSYGGPKDGWPSGTVRDGMAHFYSGETEFIKIGKNTAGGSYYGINVWSNDVSMYGGVYASGVNVGVYGYSPAAGVQGQGGSANAYGGVFSGQNRALYAEAANTSGLSCHFRGRGGTYGVVYIEHLDTGLGNGYGLTIYSSGYQGVQPNGAHMWLIPMDHIPPGMGAGAICVATYNDATYGPGTYLLMHNGAHWMVMAFGNPAAI